MMVMPAGVAAAAGGVGGVRGGVHGRLMGLVVDLHVLLMRGLMHLLMQGVNGLVLLLLDDRIRVVRRRQSMPGEKGASSGRADDDHEDAGERQHEEKDEEFHGMGGILRCLWLGTDCLKYNIG